MMECMLPPIVLMRVARWLEGGGERLSCFAAITRGIATALMRCRLRDCYLPMALLSAGACNLRRIAEFEKWKVEGERGE